MKFICSSCNMRMKSYDVTGAGNGTLSVASFCPQCGGRFSLLANQGETLLLKAVNAGPDGQRLMSNLLLQASDTLPSALDQHVSEESSPDPGWQKMKEDWVWVSPGEFMMGSPESEPGREIDEALHGVQITKGFFLGKYVITRGHWEKMMGTSPWRCDGGGADSPTLPAVCISWHDVQDFISRLNACDNGVKYRLPTEAEWEYACRAGTTSMWSFGEDRHTLSEYAWYIESESDAEGQSASEVGTKLANPWGLHDMHGNVWEWCQDVYGHDYYSKSTHLDPTGPYETEGAARVARGGYYRYFTRHSRSASRNARYPFERHRAVGARLVKDVAPS